MGEPATREQEMADFLREHLSLDALAVFYERFAGVRIPKRSRHLIHQQRVRILFAALVRVVPPRSPLTEAMARAVAVELDTTPDHVRRVWAAWNRVGRPKRNNGSVHDATAPTSFRW